MSEETEDGANSVAFAVGQLRSFVERVERLEAKVNAINRDKSEIYKEVKAMGLDARILRKVIAIRRLDKSKALEDKQLLELYLDALGMGFLA